jgi:hypothetical protein
VAGSLLSVALLLLICNTVSLVREAQNAPLPRDQLTAAIALVAGLSAAYAALALWAVYQPMPPATLGLILFLGLMAYEFSGGGNPWRGLFVKIFILLILIQAVATASRAGAVAAEPGQEQGGE